MGIFNGDYKWGLRMVLLNGGLYGDFNWGS